MWLLSLLSNSTILKRWDASNKIRSRRDKSPLILLLLGTFGYFGRGWTFDGLEGSTVTSKEVLRNFFHKFIEFGGTVLYSMFVKYPLTFEETSAHTSEFNLAGLHGVIRSMDAYHVMIEKCYHRLKQIHLGGKSKQTNRSYNLTCYHRREILHTICGHPTRWNEKTIALYDKLARSLKNEEILQDNMFELFERSGDRSVTTDAENYDS